MNFRLELLDIDRDLLASLYGDEDMSVLRQAVGAVEDLDGEGSLRPMYERDTCADELGAEDWQIRRSTYPVGPGTTVLATCRPGMAR
ncbi:hypothetical protein A0H81_12440 [Grifola frondosa]|uniref:Uncharacterized protein n=1 Tax=Grifola frondosa TaxID=5627 RepID=A0A1C7LRV0_GRIFR|nr:hypothetical protein A0H81_12440 [Grifola frondosa]